MEFLSSSGRKRPVMLSEETRLFAYESLNHKYGLDTMRVQGVAMDGCPGFDELSPVKKYDAMIRKIALESPVRICPQERISGAATLGAAIRHVVPASVEGEYPFGSVSHLTIDFRTVLCEGIDGMEKRVEESLSRQTAPEKREFLESCKSCIESMRLWHARYLDALKGRAGFERNHQNLLRVPFAPAAGFYEAVQSLWFTFAFVRLCGNWPGIGRIDQLLGGYLKADLASGALTLNEAREILAHFFIKGCEWITGGECGSGDAQHYQNLVLAGVDEDGNEVANEVTYLVLDIISELGIGDFPTTVRINSRSPQELLRRAAETISYGGGAVAVYNEELIIESLTDYGYPLREARGFANDGCWEVQIPGKTWFIYSPFDSLGLLQQKTLDKYSSDIHFDSFEELYDSYIVDLRSCVRGIFEGISRTVSKKGGEWVWQRGTPCTVISLFEGGCIEKGLSYCEGGPVYHVFSPHIGGLPDTVNSLYAIKKLVFDEGRIGFGELMRAIRANWEGFEPLRQYTLSHYSWFGNDNDEVDLLAARLLDDFADICASFDGLLPYRFPGGVSTFGRQIEWAPRRMACPFGSRAGEVLSGNLSPTPGTETEGATAVIKSCCKADLKKQVTGAALDIKLLPQCVGGEEGVGAIAGLIRGFAALGGCFMQLDVVDNSTLRLAQERPEDYQTLSVRVSGWNARFVTLNREWQDMIIGKTEQGV